ncbi:MAG: hypothetical protein DHS20C18_20930 [Saprospiraceae bacterium]|nr:MAG: hypothetical protein DHS20C18_20930 [Saprospiraceae bacterium]
MPACTDPTQVGAELLEEDGIDVGFTDTLTLRSSTLTGDTVRTYTPSTNSQLLTFLFGDFADPVFGRSTSNIYVQTRLQRASNGLSLVFPDFENAVLDSVVLVLRYDSTGFYGDTDQSFGIEVSEIMDQIDPAEDYYSNVSFNTDMQPFTNYEFTPNLDSVEVFDYSGSDVDTLSFVQLRIPMPATLGQRFIDADTSIYANDSVFLDFFNGLKLSPSKETNGMLGFNFGRFSATDLLRSGIYVYYTVDTLQKQYLFQVNDFSTKIAAFENDHTSALVEPFINNASLGDSLVFIQAMEGLNTRIDFPNIDDLKGFIVNKAELEIGIATVSGDDPQRYTPLEQLIVLRPNEDGDLRVISDVSFAGSNLAESLGGVVEPGMNGAPDYYNFNITAHFQDMIDGIEPNFLYFSAFPRAEQADRVVLYGANHQEFPIKLKLYYTKP